MEEHTPDAVPCADARAAPPPHAPSAPAAGPAAPDGAPAHDRRAPDGPLRRAVLGGRVSDVSRAPHYLGGAVLGLLLIWAPTAAYLAYAPKSYTSEMALILPGAGANASVNLAEIGQASSYANSPYASSSVSPTVSYKTLLATDRVRGRAAARLGLSLAETPRPRIKLLDQTSLLRIEIASSAPEEAQALNAALLEAFLAELDALRRDEIERRETGVMTAIAEYRASVTATRAEITALQRGSGLATVAEHYARVGEAATLETELRALRAALTRKRAQAARLAQTLGVSPALAAVTLRFSDDPELSGAAAALSAQAGPLAEARARFGPEHPARAPLEQAYAGALEAARRRAGALAGVPPSDVARLSQTDLAPSGERAALLAQLVRADAERAGLAAEAEAREKALATLKSRAGGLIAAAARLDDLNRDHKVAEAVFASALARTDTTKTDLFASYPLVQVVEPPSLPDAPSAPKKTIAIAAAAAATLLMLFSFLLLWVRRPMIERLIGAER
ncbi:MAG: hypothetical protein AAFR16_02955, partial [Pseudomonadota bacterium]